MKETVKSRGVNTGAGLTVLMSIVTWSNPLDISDNSSMVNMTSPWLNGTIAGRPTLLALLRYKRLACESTGGIGNNIAIITHSHRCLIRASRLGLSYIDVLLDRLITYNGNNSTIKSSIK